MNLKRFVHTVRYLKWRQIAWRIIRHCQHPQPKPGILLPLRSVATEWLAPIPKRITMQGPQRFCLLNETYDVETAQDWNHPQRKRLWLYSLHYFDDLCAQDADQRTQWHQDLLHRWVIENPASAKGVGWESYTISLRLVNWIKWALAGNHLDDTLLTSMVQQTRALRRRLEYHLLGNHLLANMKALIFAGLFFSGPEAESWYQKGLHAYQKELSKQILDDGGHFELSPMYHALILEDILDVINVSRTYGKTVPNSWLYGVEKMMPWLQFMLHPDGKLAFFNDTAFGIAATFEQLQDYSARLNLIPVKPISNGAHHLPNTGYVRVQDNDTVAFLDIAAIGPDYLPGHAHADSLSFELSIHGQRVLVNSGTSVYDVCALRSEQRGTLAHNTLEIDGENSSEVWKSFRVGRRARIQQVTTKEAEGKLTIAATHTGYKRLSGKPRHRRHWSFGKNHLHILDQVLGKEEHNLVLALHFHPDIKLQLQDQYTVCVRNAAEQRLATINFDKKVALQLDHGKWYPEFGLALPNLQLFAKTKATLPTSIKWSIHW